MKYILRTFYYSKFGQIQVKSRFLLLSKSERFYVAPSRLWGWIQSRSDSWITMQHSFYHSLLGLLEWAKNYFRTLGIPDFAKRHKTFALHLWFTILMWYFLLRIYALYMFPIHKNMSRERQVRNKVIDFYRISNTENRLL